MIGGGSTFLLLGGGWLFLEVGYGSVSDRGGRVRETFVKRCHFYNTKEDKLGEKCLDACSFNHVTRESGNFCLSLKEKKQKKIQETGGG